MTSSPVTKCQICGNMQLEPIFFAGYLPLVNTMRKKGAPLVGEMFYPAQLLLCHECFLVQLGTVVDPKILFPNDYAYRSSTTRLLRDNFTDLCREVQKLGYGKPGDLVVDIGSNDGELLSNFIKAGFAVTGVEPTSAAFDAINRGIITYNGFLGKKFIDFLLNCNDRAKIITACNVFAHVPDPHEFLKCVKTILADNGVFIIEVQYLANLQYDTIYHEHNFYYSLASLNYLLGVHDFSIIHCKKIPTHAGSIRIYATRNRNVTKSGNYSLSLEAASILHNEEDVEYKIDTNKFADKFIKSKMDLLRLLYTCLCQGKIYGIGCPSRAVTLINYVGLDGVLDCVCEIKGSPKIGNYVPGTNIKVVDESKLYEDQPEYALLLSWHLADELIPKIREKGFKGQFILPLPEPKIIGE